MSKFICSLLLCMFLVEAGAIAQTTDDIQYQKDLCSRKIEKYNSMKTNGMVMTIGGGALAIGGLLLLSNSMDGLNEYDNGYYADTNSEANAFFGALMAEVGVGIAAGGIVLWSIGAKKVKTYSNKLNSLSFNIKDDPRRALSLTYRF